MRKRVVVSGVGLVTPLGVGVEATWRRLLAGECAVRRLPQLVQRERFVVRARRGCCAAGARAASCAGCYRA